MALRRKQPPPPCACGCQLLAERLAEAAALNAAFARAIVALRPIARHHSVFHGLVAWRVPEADARLITEAIRTQPADVLLTVIDAGQRPAEGN
jgi:hypothetical protein